MEPDNGYRVELPVSESPVYPVIIPKAPVLDNLAGTVASATASDCYTLPSKDRIESTDRRCAEWHGRFGHRKPRVETIDPFRITDNPSSTD